jgi:hypothetical protein
VKVIRTGVSRTVWLVGRWAVKVPSLRGGSTGGWLHSFCQGVLANQSERTWSGFESWQGKVAPVLHCWLGGIVNVYPRCQPVPHDDYWARDQPDLDPELGIDPGDRKACNYGLLDGQVVRVDYVM